VCKPGTGTARPPCRWHHAGLGSLLALLLGLSQPAQAARYLDPSLRFTLELPPGWQVRRHPPGAPAENAVRLRPPRRTDRDRGLVRIDVWSRPALSGAGLQRYLAGIGREGDAMRVRRKPTGPGLPYWVEYRIGAYASDGQWQVERRLEGVYLSQRQLWTLRCVAAESEFRRYRRMLESACLSFAPPGGR